MKTVYKLILIPILFSFLISLHNAAQAQVSSTYKTVNGIIKDATTKKRVDHVNISIANTNIGTITNEDGEFILKISDSIESKELLITRLGYKNKLMPLNIGQTQLEIFLAPEVTQLAEVLVESANPAEIVKKAIDKIADNYSKTPNLLTGFYRETAQKRSEYITISEAVTNIYKTAYNEDETRDKVQVYKGRTLLSPKLSDTIVVKLQGGPNIAKYLDVIKNGDFILDAETIHFYDYRLSGTTIIDNRLHYVIEFEPRLTIEYPLYYGKHFIDKESLAFSRTELSLDMGDKDKAKKMILVKSPSKMRFQPISLNSLITYHTKEGKSYLNYIQSEIKFKCNWKRFFYIFAPTYTITSEVVITDRKTENVKSFSSKVAFGDKQTLLDKIETFYDPDFWEGYNIIAPTESLENAVNKLKKQYK